MRILFIGDIFAKTGRRAVATELPNLRKDKKIDFVIANGENCTHGKGMIWKHYHELKDAGIDFFTMGNHTWAKPEIFEILKSQNDIIRPYNIKQMHEYAMCGVGSRVVTIKGKQVRITNLLGQTVACWDIQTNPFVALQEIIKNDDSDIHFVDMHTETTSEKNAFLMQFNGQVATLVGTHTHIQSADERIYNNTAYLSDAGMTGPHNGIIGAKPEAVLKRFWNPNERFILEEAKGPYQLNGVIIEYDDVTNIPIKIERVNIVENNKR